MEKLNTKLWKLYNFIKYRTENNIPTTVKDICDEFPDTYKLNAKESNFTNCPALYEDIDTLNASAEVNKVIIKDNNDFRFGTEEEVKNYANKLQIHALKQLKKYWDIQRKTMYQGQMKLLSNRDEPIDDKSRAERFVNAFIDTLEPVHYDDEFLMNCSLKQLHEYTKSIGGYVLYGWNKEDYIKEIRNIEKHRNK